MIPHPVAVPPYVDDVAVMDQPVDQGCSHDLVLTADHVVRNQARVRVMNTSGQNLRIGQSSCIMRHQAADVAAIILPAGTWKDAENFELGFPNAGFADHPLGEGVLSYGFPQMGAEKPIPPRLMKGHLQRRFQCHDEHYTYSSFELGFPAFHGQSGSPVILDNLAPQARNTAIGVVTRSVSFRSETDGEVVETSWAIGASFTPLSDWIKAL